MQITKEALLADKQAFLTQIKTLQGLISYVDGLLVYLDKEEPKEECAKPDSE